MPESTTQTTTQSTFQSTSDLTIETIFQSIDKPILRLCLNDFHLDTSTLLPTSKSTIESTTAVSHSADHSIKRTHRNLSDVPWVTRYAKTTIGLPLRQTDDASISDSRVPVRNSVCHCARQMMPQSQIPEFQSGTPHGSAARRRSNR